MDTNLIAQLVAQAVTTAFDQHKHASSFWDNPGILASIATLIVAIGAWISSRAAERRGQSTAMVVEKIHTDVNSGKTAMVEAHREVVGTLDRTVRELNQKILEISKELATARGQQIASVQPVQPQPPHQQA